MQYTTSRRSQNSKFHSLPAIKHSQLKTHLNDYYEHSTVSFMIFIGAGRCGSNRLRARFCATGCPAVLDGLGVAFDRADSSQLHADSVRIRWSLTGSDCCLGRTGAIAGVAGIALFPTDSSLKWGACHFNVWIEISDWLSNVDWFSIVGFILRYKSTALVS